MLYEFCSKFYNLSSGERILKIGPVLAKLQQVKLWTFFWDTVYYQPYRWYKTEVKQISKFTNVKTQTAKTCLCRL